LAFKLKLCIAGIISIFPWFLKPLLYRLLLGYKVSSSARIGFLTMIAVDKADIAKCSIGSFNFLVGPYSLTIAENFTMFCRNTISVRNWVTDSKNADYERYCYLGKDTLVADLHYIDPSGGFELQEGSWLGGRGSQFWTHGALAANRKITIGSNCYIGSAVRFKPGTTIGNGNIVSLGSVVTKSFALENALIGGSPATVLKEDYNGKYK